MFNESLFESMKEAYKGLKVVGIIVAILLVLLGIAMFFSPLEVTGIFLWILVIGLFIKGISDIVLFCKTPKGAKDGAVLALGIIWVIISIFFIISGLNASLTDGLFITLTFQAFIGIFMGVSMIFNGVSMLASSGQIKAMGGSSGLAIFGGILELMLGMFMLSTPFIAGIALTLVYGIFLIVAGVSLFCRAVSM